MVQIVGNGINPVINESFGQPSGIEPTKIIVIGRPTITQEIIKEMHDYIQKPCNRTERRVSAKYHRRKR